MSDFAATQPFDTPNHPPTQGMVHLLPVEFSHEVATDNSSKAMSCKFLLILLLLLIIIIIVMCLVLVLPLVFPTNSPLPSSFSPASPASTSLSLL